MKQIAFYLLISILLLGGQADVHAQSFAPTILRNEADVQFPDTVTFQLQFDGPVAAAVLTYDVVQVSCLEASAQVPVEMDGNRLEWTWVMSRSGNPPPGAVLWWEWTLTDGDGRTFTTPRQTITLTDDRFDMAVCHRRKHPPELVSGR